MTHIDRVGGPSGRRNVAGDVIHRQDISTPSDGPPTRPERRPPKAFGQRRVRLVMIGITTTHAYGRNPWGAVYMGHY